MTSRTKRHSDSRIRKIQQDFVPSVGQISSLFWTHFSLQCTGVMTKPDMLSAGSTKARELWLDVIEGRRHVLSHGYYCTRQPDDAERSESISTAEARQNEKYFFENTPPWSTSNYQQRLGTQNLISRLSELLVQIINNSCVFLSR
jgi:hypothetical protein